MGGRLWAVGLQGGLPHSYCRRCGFGLPSLSVLRVVSSFTLLRHMQKGLRMKEIESNSSTYFIIIHVQVSTVQKAQLVKVVPTPNNGSPELVSLVTQHVWNEGFALIAVCQTMLRFRTAIVERRRHGSCFKR